MMLAMIDQFCSESPVPVKEDRLAIVAVVYPRIEHKSSQEVSEIGSNIAYFERVCNELAVFDRVIHVPILLIAFE